MKKNTWEEGFVEKGAVDGIVKHINNGQDGFDSDFKGGCNNGADDVCKTYRYKF